MGTLMEAVVAWHGGTEKGARLAFSKAVGVSDVTVYRWCFGSPIDERKQPKVATVLGITVQELRDIHHPTIKSKHLREVATCTVPVVGILNGNDEYFNVDFETSTPIEELKCMPTTNGEDESKMRAVRVAGKLGDLAGDGDYLFIRLMDKPDGKRPAVVRLSSGYSIKRITVAGKVAILKSERGGKTLRLPTEALNVVGVVCYVLKVV